MRVCGFFRESFGPQKSLGFFNILAILGNMSQRRWTLSSLQVPFPAKFRKGECTQGCGLCDLCILLWGVIYLLFHLLNCQSVELSCDSLFLEQILLVELGSHASLPTSWVPVTIHLPCGIRNPCVRWVTCQLERYYRSDRKMTTFLMFIQATGYLYWEQLNTSFLKSK